MSHKKSHRKGWLDVIFGCGKIYKISSKRATGAMPKSEIIPA